MEQKFFNQELIILINQEKLKLNVRFRQGQ